MGEKILSLGKKFREERIDLKKASEHLKDPQTCDILLIQPELPLVFQIDHLVVQIGKLVAETVTSLALLVSRRRVVIHGID